MTLTEEQREATRAVSDLPRAIGCTQCHSYIQEHYGNQFAILRAMIDGSGTVEPAGGFDLERARGLRDFLQDDCAEVGDVWAEMIAEIGRLREALDKSEQILAHKTKTSTHWYEEGLQTRADLVQCKRVVEQQAARIKELEDAHKRSGKKYAKIINELRSSVYANIPGLDVGKIGPDAAKPRSWQITKERIGLLEYCLETLLDAPDIEEIPGPGHSIEMLRAMLREAGL